MGAKDTVMSREQIKAIIGAKKNEILSRPDAWAGERVIAEFQAEISFKAGEQIGFAKGVILKVKELSLLNEDEMVELNAQAKVYLDAVKQEGIKEVVEWVRLHRTETTMQFVDFVILKENWQAKLKEWGLVQSLMG